MNPIYFITTAAFALACTVGHAQERTAGGTTETQMTWSTLSNQISTVTSQLNGLDTKIKRVEECGRDGQLYAPGAADADTRGCLDTTTPGADIVIKTDTSSGVTNNGTTTQTFTIPAGTREIIITPTCRVKGSQGVATIQLSYGGSSYPKDLLCTVGGVSDSDTSTMVLSKVLRLPAKAKTVKITYSSSKATATSSLDTTIIYMK